jgi:hypothetical protein
MLIRNVLAFRENALLLNPLNGTCFTLI